MTTAPTPTPTILVVDDDPVQRMPAVASLEHAGFAVVEAGSGPEALELFERDKPHLLLLDVQMPGLNGFEVCEQLRATPSGSHVPILMLTGLDDVGSIEDAYRAGATDFVVKPVNWVIMGHRVEYMLRASRITEALRESRRKLEDAQRMAHLGYWEWRPQGDRLFCSEQMRRLFDLPDEAPPGLDSLYPSVLDEDRGKFEEFIIDLVAGTGVHEIEYRVHENGRGSRFVRQHAEMTLEPQSGDLLVTGTVQDVTDMRRAEERIRLLANFDALTGLPNRRHFARQLGAALEEATRRRQQLALFLIDLDRFKRFNDTFGHETGDQLLHEVSGRLLQRSGAQGETQDFDISRPFLSRFGGDEFLMLLPRASSLSEAASAGRRLLEVVAEPYELRSHRISMSASVGIAMFPDDGENADTLVANADTAMHHAKSTGGNCFQFFSESMNSTVLERVLLEEELRAALRDSTLALHYQPQFSPSGELLGAEALARWQHPERGDIAPSTFIPLAEETGQIDRLGRWALITACRQAAQWLETGRPGVAIGVNVSGLQLVRENFTDSVQEVLELSGLQPELLVLELTESTLIGDAEDVHASLRSLKETGVSLSVDDFGTGYCSLSYLSRFPLDSIKIDRSFIRDLPADPENLAIVRAILAMARSLQLQVVAEGVETMEQHQLLADEGCDALQGFLLGRPVAADSFFTDQMPVATADPDSGSRQAGAL